MTRPTLSPRRTAPQRWLLCAALLLGGFAVGGGLGTLMLIAAAFVVLDAVLPTPRSPQAEAEEHFARIARTRRQRRTPQLALVDDAAGPLAVAGRREMGVELIPLDSITGTTEASKARLFDRGFRPDRSCEARWKSLWMAGARGLALPPVSVYRIGERHVLRDGHHRVSVARDHGRDEIEAEVVELRQLTTSRLTSSAQGRPRAR